MADGKKNGPPEITEEEFQGMVFEDGGNLTVNLQNVEEMKFENVPKGTYLAEIDEATFGQSKSSQQPMITMKWKIVGGEYDGRTLMQFLSFSRKALSGTKSNISRIAPELTTQPWQPQQLCDNGYFLGKQAKIRVDIGEYEGQDRSQIKGLIAVGGASGEGLVNR